MPLHRLRRAQRELEHEGEIARRLETRGRLLLQAVIDDVAELRGDLDVVRQRRRLARENRGARSGRGLARKWPRPRDHLVEDHAQAEDVRALVAAVTASLFRRPV